MQDIVSIIATLKRPKLLMQAARVGAADYKRKNLKRIFGTGDLPGHGQALVWLMDIEAQMNEQRQSGAAWYSPSRHIEVMVALLGEMRLMRADRA